MAFSCTIVVSTFPEAPGDITIGSGIFISFFGLNGLVSCVLYELNLSISTFVVDGGVLSTSAFFSSCGKSVSSQRLFPGIEDLNGYPLLLRTCIISSSDMGSMLLSCSLREGKLG